MNPKGTVRILPPSANSPGNRPQKQPDTAQSPPVDQSNSIDIPGKTDKGIDIFRRRNPQNNAAMFSWERSTPNK